MSDAEFEVLWESDRFQGEHGVIRIARWPEGIVLWVGGEIRWKSWSGACVTSEPINPLSLGVPAGVRHPIGTKLATFELGSRELDGRKVGHEQA